jgi:hypothetical protein
MKYSILLLISLFFSVAANAQETERKINTLNRWIMDAGTTRPVLNYIAEYDGLDNRKENMVITVIKPVGQRAGFSFWMITGGIYEPAGMHLQIGDNKPMLLENIKGQTLIENGYALTRDSVAQIDFLKQIVDSKEMTIWFDDSLGITNTVKVQLEDFNKIYATLN